MPFAPLICDEFDDILYPGAMEELFHGRRYKHKGKEFHRDKFCKKRRHPWAFQQRRESNTREVETQKDSFQVNLNVKQFSSEDLTVKTVNDLIVVEGKHEEKEDEHGSISRHFIRKYKLPEEYDLSTVRSNLSSDGVLIITSTKKTPESNEKEIPINFIGPVKRTVATTNENKEKNQQDAEEIITL